MSPLTIRRARSQDVEVIVEFNARLAQETENRTLDRSVLSGGVSALLKDQTKGMYYVAMEGTTAVGQLMITYEWSDWRNGTFWWIQSVYVHAQHRGKGIFRGLYDHVLAEAKSRADVVGLRLYVDRHNRTAQETYERLGMRKSEYEMYDLDFVLGSP